jgi:diacylglycerol kinase (ATP)
LIIPAILLSPFLLWQQVILFCTYFLILIVELINASIENVVDLVTNEIQPLAKNADIGATAVMFSIILHTICWGLFIFV